MRVNIRKKNLDFTPALRTYIEQKLVAPVKRLLDRRLLPDLPILDIEVERTTRHHHKGRVYRAAATLTLDHVSLRAQADGEDVRAACDGLEDELKREITTYKTKAQSLQKRGARRAKKDLHLARAARLFRKGRIRDEGN